MDRGRSGDNGSEAYLQAVHRGPGPMQIAKLLQEEKVLNPTAYKRQIDIKTPIPETADPYHWNTNTVVNILERREYTGCTVNFKTCTNSIWDKSSGKRWQNIRISYDLVGFIPLNELVKEETA